MNPKDIAAALNDIDPVLVAESAPKQKKKTTYRWLAAAACLVLLAGVGLLRPWQLYRVDLGGVTRLYRAYAPRTESGALIFPWEYRPLYDQYHAMTLEGKAYRTRANTISEDLLGDYLGHGEAFDYDIYTESTNTQEFPVYAIAGIDPKLLVAVEQGGQYYVFMEEAYDPPADLGEFLDGYALPKVLTFEGFTLFTEGYEGEYRRLTDSKAGTAYIWQILSECREAAYKEQEPFAEAVHRVTFTATAEPLGIYKKAFTVKSDGFLDTNIAEYGYAFYIGEEAAATIIDYVTENSREARQEPYQYSVAGIITEIRDGYFLLDNSALAAGKGMVFKVPTDDLRISRWLDFGRVEVGDTVSVTYTGGIEDGTVQDPVDLSPAILENGNVLIPE